ncbi:MAG TPA: LPS export ABC transporter permease LptG [Thermoanaerobaculia bacterium]|nr:LPS export ABC transporter permease LptG [Thermoanaerobaculia bacterium]
MRILTRYIFRELLGPTTLGFSFYTLLILIKNLFDFAELIIKRSLPFSTVLELLALSLPHIVVLTLPMALLVGILIAIGRLSADSEIIAMQSAGLSSRAIYRPVFIFSLLMFGITLYLMLSVLPRGNRALQQRQLSLLTMAAETKIQPRVFFDEFQDRVIYINDVDAETGLWKGIFIADTSDPNQQRTILADSGRLTMTAGTRQSWLELHGPETHVSSSRRPDRYDLNRNDSQRLFLHDPTEEVVKVKKLAKSMKEMGLPELLDRLEQARREQDPLDERFYRVEIHQRFAIPFACIAFGVIGLPLGITNRRGGKSSGFSLSILIILVYYILLNNGESLARSGRLPAWIAMWAANFLILGLGFWLMGKTGSERQPGRIRGFLGLLVRRLAQRRGSKIAAAAEASEDDDGGILKRIDIPLPNILDRYILTQYLKILGLVLLSTIVLFLVVDYTEIIQDINENDVPFEIVVSYYRYVIFQFFDWVLPISVLVATLITFGVLSKNNEVTAIKANGISLYRIALPVLAVAVLLSIFSYFLLDFVLPYSNSRAAELKSVIEGDETPSTFSSEQRQWVFGRGRYLFNFLRYDKRTKTLSRVQIFEFHPSEFKLARRVVADEARWDGTGWVFVGGWVRSFGDDGGSSYTPIVQPVRLHYPERPSYFEVEAKTPGEMTWGELRRYIGNLKRLGYSPDELTVQLWRKTSWPFISVIMALIALPFSFRMGKKGALYGIGIALFLAFGYWSIFGIFTKLGEVGSLPAVLAAWSANVLFMLAALYMFLRVET